ncbi:MAG: GNAT family N-acetyltransferase [Phycisphaera sp.]|nr:GNAT family N-acetyltransferase [Phycisphaera sp.]
MGPNEPRTRLTRLRARRKSTLGRRLLSAVGVPIVERALALPQLERIYAQVHRAPSCDAFLEQTLNVMGVTYDATEQQLARIPKEGPVVIVANHPFGAIEGLILGQLLRRVRPDVKIMANHLLGRIRHLREIMLFVNPFGGPEAAKANLASMRQSLEWVGEGHLLGVFPAGTVSHWQLSKHSVTDPAWSTTVARIVRRTKATVVPIYFGGRNRAVFQLAGMIHPTLRTLMLPHEFIHRRDSHVDLRIGRAISHDRLAEFEDDADMTQYLRMRTYLLGMNEPHGEHGDPAESGAATTNVSPGKRRTSVLSGLVDTRLTPGVDNEASGPTADTPVLPTPHSVKGSHRRAGVEPVIDPVDPTILQREIDALPEDAMILSSGDYDVYYGTARQLPNVLREIGRLREITFRGVGEGTGKSIDLDRFDEDYLHLFVWDREPQMIVGAYRLGQTDVILPKRGPAGLYTTTLFKFKRGMLEQINPALELGRSFVRPEYQKSYSGLLLLWKGLAHYCVRHPRYRQLFGPVSISDDYTDLSQWMMMAFMQTHRPSDLADMVKPKNPPHLRQPRHWDPQITQRMLSDIDEVSNLISEIDPEQRGVPILFKQYLKLGARHLGFNVDPEFGNTLDALVLVDLIETDQRILKNYMGREGLRAFRTYHGAESI